ncbi:pyrokinin-1 receptor-like [Littorina saxatilis]|uniref:G-protein coupled receptors family 1 profile domain-containing protein n=1 Tax=Littorina saxatilis TaxID=31220 RepID=A0AAN9C068_9CAEN
MASDVLPPILNMTAILTVIQSLSPKAREQLLNQMGIGSDDLRQLVGRALVPEQVFSEAERMKYSEYRAHKLLRLYVPPILLLLGTFGNIFSFLILRHKAMARQSTHHFLAALAVMDSLVLYIGLFRKWIGDLTGFDPQTQSEWLCKGIVTLGYTCSNVSVWIIVAVTVERYIVVCYPLKANMVCNVTRAKRVVVCLVALFLLVNLHFLWTSSITWQEGSNGERHSPQCSSQEGHEFLITAVWPWVDAMLYGFGPFLIILVLNIVIIVHVVRATSGRVILQNRGFPKSPARKTCTANGNHYQVMQLARSTSSVSVNSNSISSSSGNSNSSHNNNDNVKPNISYHSLAVPGPQANGHTNSNGAIAMSQRRGGGGCGGEVRGIKRPRTNTNVRLTVMLLTVSFTFLLTTLPMNVSVIAAAFWNRQAGDVATMSKFQLVFTVAELLMYLNHSVNFFLYCATGHKFRSEMVRMVCGKQRPSAAISDHSQHIFCSRACVASGFTEIRNTADETEL